jgi:dipeptidase E
MIYLTSQFDKVAKKVYEDIGIQNPKTVFIYTAAEEKYLESDWLHKDKKALEDTGFILTDYTISGKAHEEVKKFVQDFDVIYVAGGDTFHLLEEARKVNFKDILDTFLQNKIYIGQSAGSVLLGTSVSLKSNPPKTSLKDFNGLKLVDFTLIPHWGRISAKDSKQKLFDKMYELDSEIVLLRDNTYIISDDKLGSRTTKFVT